MASDLPATQSLKDNGIIIIIWRGVGDRRKVISQGVSSYQVVFAWEDNRKISNTQRFKMYYPGSLTEIFT